MSYLTINEIHEAIAVLAYIRQVFRGDCTYFLLFFFPGISRPAPGCRDVTFG